MPEIDPTERPRPHFLVLQEFHLSRTKAQEAVIRTLQESGVACPAQGWESFTLNWKLDGSQATFLKLIQEARQLGIVERIQKYLDRKDSVFGGTLGENATANWQMKWMTEYAGFKKEAQGPCRTSCVEHELMEDILDYRRQACAHSNEYNFRLTCRYFRAYLSACMSIVDAFINRHILLAEHDGFTSPEFESLKNSTNVEERFRLWFTVCSDHDPSSFFSSREWCHFQELRTRRNELLHAVEPIGVYSMKDIQLYLNKVRTGIGGLLHLMRIAHEKPTLGFIERLRTAPLVDFLKISFKSDGTFESERHQGQ